jgi:structural maintenance of chromosomes protein 5
LELIKLEESVSTDASQLDTLKDVLKRKETELNRLNLDKEREVERVKAEETLDLLQKKVMWLIFEDLRDKTFAAKDEKEKAKKEYAAACKEVEPLEQKLDEIQAHRKKLDVKSQKLEQSVLDTKKEMEKQKKKFDHQDDEIEGTCCSIIEIDTNRDARQREYDQAVEKLTELESTSAGMNFQEAQDKFEHAKNQARATKKEMENAKREYRAIESESREHEDRAKQLQTKLARLSDDSTLRRDKILSSNANLKKIYEWLQMNRARFRKNVYGPIAAEINATKFANCVEYHVPGNILFSFVCEVIEDQNLLFKHIRTEMNIPINIVCVENSTLEKVRPYSDQQMDEFKSRHGVLGYLDEMFTCIEPVMIALQKFARVHKVIVGGAKSQDSIDNHGLRDLISKKSTGELQGSCIFTTKGDHTFRYTQKVSEYSKKLSSKEDQCSQPRLLAPGVDPKQKEAVENELNQAHAVLNELRPKVTECKKRAGDLDSAAKESHLAAEGAKKDYDDIRKYHTKVDRQRDRVKEKEQLLQADDASDRKDLVKKLLQRWKSSVICVEAHGEEHERMMLNTTQNAGIVIQMTVLRTREGKVK